MIRSATSSSARGATVRRTAREPLAGRLAGVAGAVVGRGAELIRRSAFGVGAVLCIAGGAWMIYRPAGLIVLGGFLLAADRAT